jgi:hypothetical protein
MKKELILGWRDVQLPIGIERGDGETEMMR